MQATEIVNGLPELDAYERDRILLDHAAAGHVVVEWIWLDVGGGLEVQVMRDALKWGEPGDAVRLGTTAYTEQRIADHLGAVLLTPKLCDLIAARARDDGGLVLPNTQGINTRTSGYVKHSHAIDMDLPAGFEGVVDGFKNWCVSADVWRKRGFVTNYGWHVPVGTKISIPTDPSVSDPTLRVIQGPYEAHDTGIDRDGDGYADSGHGDYSQFDRYGARATRLHGRPGPDLAEIYTGEHGPELAALVSSDGALPGWRLPGVDFDGHGAPAPDAPAAPRTTRPGERGADVLRWQRYLLAWDPNCLPRFGDDGDHGGETEAATKRWREAQQLDRPRPAHPDIAPDTRPTGTRRLIEVPAISFRAAKFYGHGLPYGPHLWVTIHTAQIAELTVAAERLQAYGATMQGRVASWHEAHDCDSIAASVHLSDRSWGAACGNDRSVHVELAGDAFQGAAGWADKYSQSMLEITAARVAEICKQLNIPPIKRDMYDLIDERPGIVGHVDWTGAIAEARRRGLRERPWFDEQRQRWRVTNHVDPGPTFPWRWFVDRVRDYFPGDVG